MDNLEILDSLRTLMARAPDSTSLLHQVVSLLRRERPHYHWVGVYLLQGAELVLGPLPGQTHCPHPHPPRPGHLRRGSFHRPDNHRGRRARRPSLPRLQPGNAVGDRRSPSSFVAKSWVKSTSIATNPPRLPPTTGIFCKPSRRSLPNKSENNGSVA